MKDEITSRTVSRYRSRPGIAAGELTTAWQLDVGAQQKLMTCGKAWCVVTPEGISATWYGYGVVWRMLSVAARKKSPVAQNSCYNIEANGITELFYICLAMSANHEFLNKPTEGTLTAHLSTEKNLGSIGIRRLWLRMRCRRRPRLELCQQRFQSCVTVGGRSNPASRDAGKEVSSMDNRRRPQLVDA